MGIKSIDYFKRSLSLNKEIGNTNAVKTIFNNIGFINSEYGDYHSAINYFNKSLDLSRKQNKKWDIATEIINKKTAAAIPENILQLIFFLTFLVF